MWSNDERSVAVVRDRIVSHRTRFTVRVLRLGLHIHHGPHLAPLTDQLATVLRSPLADVFATEVVAVPTAGVRDWLEQRLALQLGAGEHADGITANIQMMFPGRFNATALGQSPTIDDPWAIENLTWVVLAALDADVVHVSTRSRYLTARRVADLFDGYANNRPQMIQQWHGGHDGDGTLDERGAVIPLPEDQRWQPRLWRAVRSVIGTPSNAERLPLLLDDLRRGELVPALPERVALFGVSAVSANQLAILDALGATRAVHLFLVHPSAAAWHDSRELAGRLELRTNVDVTAKIHHPLLRSWARSSLESAALIRGLDVSVHEYGRPASASHSLLTALQQAISQDSTATLIAAAAHDRSIQIHACPGTTRQLEVLRDALCHLFSADATLTPHDVVIVCPDLDRFAPLIASVFQRSTLPLPVRVSDLSLGHGNPVASTLATVLEVLADRCTVPEVLGLCALDPVMRRFGFERDDIETISRWTASLATSWGLDGTHRSDWLSTPITDATWGALLDSVLIGAAMPAPMPRTAVGGIVPFDDVDADGLATAGRLAELLTRLGAARHAVAATHNISAWATILTDLVSSLCATAPDDAWQLTQVVEQIGNLRRRAAVTTDPNDALLSPTDVRAALSERFADSSGRLMLRSGSITVTAMVPVRNVPNRVVCVLGLDEAALRSGGTDGDDLLGVRPCVGERDQRAEGRHLLLDVLLTAGDHVIITYDGADITTNRELAAPVVITELLDALDASAVGPASSPACRSRVVFRHPRQAYDAQNFVTASTEDRPSDPGRFASGQPFSFDAGMLFAASINRRGDAVRSIQPLLPLAMPSEMSIAQLTESCTRPARTYLSGRLEARLPREIEEIETNIPIDVSPLTLSMLGRDLLDQYRRPWTAGTISQWRAAQRLGGVLPPRALADGVLDVVQVEVDRILDAVPGVREQITNQQSRQIDLVCTAPDSPSTPVRVVHSIEQIDAHTIVRAAFSRPNKRYEIAAALELAALTVTDPTHRWQALLVNRPKRAGDVKATITRLIPIDGDGRVPAARHLLEVAVDLRLRALREPLPLFEAASFQLYSSGEFDEEDLDRELFDQANRMLWETYAPDEILAIPLRPDDELAGVAAIGRSIGAGRAESLTHYLWRAVMAFVPNGQSTTDETPAGQAS